jgi:hypothetical protein
MTEEGCACHGIGDVSAEERLQNQLSRIGATTRMNPDCSWCTIHAWVGAKRRCRRERTRAEERAEASPRHRGHRRWVASTGGGWSPWMSAINAG